MAPHYFKGRLNKEAIMAGMRSALEHLHSLGLAHNDFNVSNIMLSSDGQPILIDFGSCQPVGLPLISMATQGWFDEPFECVSKTSNDWAALTKLGYWLDIVLRRIEKGQGPGLPAEGVPMQIVESSEFKALQEGKDSEDLKGFE
jgi:serine/threonine protein kinase